MHSSVSIDKRAYAYLWVASEKTGDAIQRGGERKRFYALIILLTSLAKVTFCQAYSGAGYAANDILPMQEGESITQLTQRVLPEGAELIYDPQRIDFGADLQGVLLIFRQDSPAKQYWIWYLAPQRNRLIYHKVLVKQPEPMDEFFDLQVNQVFTVGPEGAKDLVILETFSRSVIAGGEANSAGSVYRRVQLHAKFQEEASTALDGVTTEALARKKLAPWIAHIPSSKPGSLIDYFLDLPLEYLPATRLERWNLIKPESQRLQVMDSRHGFTQIAGDAGLPGYVLGLFKSEDQDPLLALQTQWTERQQTVFLKREGGRWVDVSRDVLAGYKDDNVYKIPHLGRDLTLFGSDGQVDTVYQWNGNRFIPVSHNHATE
jgi:hypothetical protein